MTSDMLGEKDRLPWGRASCVPSFAPLLSGVFYPGEFYPGEFLYLAHPPCSVSFYISRTDGVFMRILRNVSIQLLAQFWAHGNCSVKVVAILTFSNLPPTPDLIAVVLHEIISVYIL